MYEDIIFAKALKLQYTDDINEATEIARSYCVTPSLFYLRDIRINVDGTITSGGKTSKITEHGFEKLLKVLGIPARYARTIPRDLLFTTMLRLQQDMQGEEIAILTRDNGDIAAIIKAPYDELAYLDVLSGFAEKENVNYFALSEERLVISLSFPEVSISGVDTYGSNVTNNDILYPSIFVYNSILKDVGLSVVGGIFGTSKQHSFIMPYIGKARAPYQITSHEQRLLRFLENTWCIDSSFTNILTQKFNSVLNNYKLLDSEFIKFWQGTSRVVGSFNADAIFKIEEEDRKNLASFVKDRNAHNKRAKVLHEDLEPSLSTSSYAYDVINGVAAFAKTLSNISDSLLLEKLSGSMIQSLVLN